MSLNKSYAINSQRAISETLDGETIIINLETGTYYSLNEAGSLIWKYIQSGYSLDQMAKSFVARYEASVETIEKSILDFIKILEDDNLIASANSTIASLESDPVSKMAFIAPALEKYEDMQEMLLADPIHDVDTAGWPKRKQTK